MSARPTNNKPLHFPIRGNSMHPDGPSNATDALSCLPSRKPETEKRHSMHPNGRVKVNVSLSCFPRGKQGSEYASCKHLCPRHTEKGWANNTTSTTFSQDCSPLSLRLPALRSSEGISNVCDSKINGGSTRNNSKRRRPRGRSGAANCNHPPEYVARGYVSVGDRDVTPRGNAIARMVPNRMPNKNGATVD